jgi:hypothetical protein
MVTTTKSAIQGHSFILVAIGNEGAVFRAWGGPGGEREA